VANGSGATTVTDLLKGVLGGGWALVAGWIFPAGLAIGSFLLLVAPSFGEVERSGEVGLIALGSAVALGVLFSALQTPLYRILEGYLLWPRRLADRRRQRHVDRRQRLVAAAKDAHGYRAGLANERLRRYPDEEKDIVPTALGNAVRRFEVYGWSRYQLNTQTLWYRILAVVPEATSKAVDGARANVDFFIALLYGHALVGGAAVVALVARRDGTPRLLAALAGSAVVITLAYRLAIVATDEWASAVRALADLARVPLAAALGLVLPQTLDEERAMWRVVYWLDRAGYSPEASEYLSAYRRTEKPAD
jgi:hypothetical protein